jgi:hypothetical protein
MGNTFLYRMPAGIAGAISRPQDLTVEPQLLDSSNLSPLTALAARFSSGKFVPIAAAIQRRCCGHLCSSVSDRQPAGQSPQVGSGKTSPATAWRGYVTVNIGADASSCCAWRPCLYARGHTDRLKPSRRVPCRR